jgi:outer membrane protein, multidrug efflux system
VRATPFVLTTSAKGHAVMRARLLLGLAASLGGLLAAGCKVGPDYVPPALPLVENWSAQYPSLAAPNEPPDSAWWEAFGDPVLSQLVEQVRAQNVSLQQAEARIAEARARRGIARGSLWPEATQYDALTRRQFSENGTPFGSVPFGIAPFDLWSIGFDASWEIDVAGRLRRAVEAADAELEGSVESRNDVFVRLLAEVARAYVEMRTAEERLAAANENARLQRETLLLTESRAHEGAVSPLEVSQARTQLLETEALIPELLNQIKLAEIRLGVLQGGPPHGPLAELQGSHTIPQPPPQIAVGLPVDLLRRRPDVRQAEREVAAQSARIGVAAADLYPRLALAGTFALEANNLSAAFAGDSFAYGAGPSVRWNILNFGRVRNNIAAQEARLEQTIAGYREAVLEAGAEVESSLSTLAREREREERLRLAVASAGDARHVAEIQYREGAVAFQSLLDTQRVLVRVQDEHAAARGRIAVAAVALYKALGGGWEVYPSSFAPPDTLFETLTETIQ